MRTALAGVITVALLFCCGCKSRSLESKQAVQAAVTKHLQQQSNLSFNNMNMEVQDVKFEGDRAQAEVKFSSKDRPELAVGVRYVLRRAGDHWEVESSSPTSGMGTGSHGVTGGAPPAPAPSGTAPQPSH